MKREIFQKFPARFLPKFVDITHDTKIRTIHHRTTVVRIFLPAHSNIEELNVFPMDGMSLTSSQDRNY
jgi:hypothetical protein